MNRIGKTLLTLALTLLTLPSIAQTDYTIKFEHTFESDDPDMAMVIEMMDGTNSTMYIKGNKFRSETNAGYFGGIITIIYDSDAQEMLLLNENEISGNSYTKISDSTDTVKVEQTIVKSTGTKKIAGYDCVKYTITDTSGSVTNVYATVEIATPYNSQYGGEVEGAILCTITEADFVGGKMKMTQTATEVKSGDISDDKFDMTIPEGYTELETP